MFRVHKSRMISRTTESITSKTFSILGYPIQIMVKKLWILKQIKSRDLDKQLVNFNRNSLAVNSFLLPHHKVKSNKYQTRNIAATPEITVMNTNTTYRCLSKIPLPKRYQSSKSEDTIMLSQVSKAKKNMVYIQTTSSCHMLFRIQRQMTLAPIIAMSSTGTLKITNQISKNTFIQISLYRSSKSRLIKVKMISRLCLIQNNKKNLAYENRLVMRTVYTSKNTKK